MPELKLDRLIMDANYGWLAFSGHQAVCFYLAVAVANHIIRVSSGNDRLG